MKKPAKTQYRLRNWSKYNAALKQRGSVSMWLDEAVAEEPAIDAEAGKRLARAWAVAAAMRVSRTW